MRGALLASVVWLLGCQHKVYLDDEVCGGQRGPESVRVDGVCIDSTEVTRAHYASFLNAAPELASQAPECAWNASFAPETWPPAPGSDDYPVGGVDWCDAYAYCTWAGKRLCGQLGGGPAFWMERDNANVNEWFRACSLAGRRRYPYGEAFDPSKCTVSDQLTSVATNRGCEGSYAGVFDLIGNVWEWTDSCVSSEPAGAEQAQCDRRGGATTVQPPELDCAAGELIRRNLLQADTGFRCCAGG